MLHVLLRYELLWYTNTNLTYVNRFRIFIANFPLTFTLIREVKKNRVIRLQSPDCSEGHPWDFHCNALAHTVTPICSDSRLLTYKSICVVLLREICADLP